MVTADKLSSFSEDDWARVLSKREVVFARTSPEQKLEIVTRSQLLGHVVGVTGDGVSSHRGRGKAHQDAVDSARVSLAADM